MTVFEDRVLKELIKVVLVQNGWKAHNGEVQTQACTEGRPCEDRGKDHPQAKEEVLKRRLGGSVS